MDETEDDRPETLPEQLSRVAAAGHRRAKGLPAWWGLVLWVAICFGAQIGVWGLQRYLSYLIAGYSWGLWQYYVYFVTVLPTASLLGTLLPLCGLGAALGTGPTVWRVVASLTVLILLGALQNYTVLPLMVVSYLVPWTAWLVVGLLIRRKTRSVVSAAEPSDRSLRSRWTIRDMLLLTTLAAVLCGPIGWVMRDYPLADQLGGITAGSFSWVNLLIYALAGLLGMLAKLPVLMGFFPVAPQAVTFGRGLLYAGMSVGLGLVVGLAWTYVTIVHLNPGLAMTWSNLGWQLTIQSVLSTLCGTLSLVAAAVWLRWWGYRRWRLPR